MGVDAVLLADGVDQRFLQQVRPRPRRLCQASLELFQVDPGDAAALGADNEVQTGERLFAGLFTSMAYSRSPSIIPLLRQKVDAVVKLSGFSPRSHDGKALLHILENYPRDELFQISVEDLHQIAVGVLNLQERHRTALFVRRDPFERFVSCMVFVPRDRYDTTLRRKLQDILAAAFQGTCISFSTQMSEEVLARLHLIISTERGRIPRVDLEKLEARLAEAARSWSDLLEEALVDAVGEQDGIHAHRRLDRKSTRLNSSH